MQSIINAGAFISAQIANAINNCQVYYEDSLPIGQWLTGEKEGDRIVSVHFANASVEEKQSAPTLYHTYRASWNIDCFTFAKSMDDKSGTQLANLTAQHLSSEVWKVILSYELKYFGEKNDISDVIVESINRRDTLQQDIDAQPYSHWRLVARAKVRAHLTEKEWPLLEGVNFCLFRESDGLVYYPSNKEIKTDD